VLLCNNPVLSESTSVKLFQLYFASKLSDVSLIKWIWHFTRDGVVWGGLLSGHYLLLSWHRVCLHRNVGSLVACGCRDLHLFSYSGKNKDERRIKRFASRQPHHPRQMNFLHSWFNSTWGNLKSFVKIFLLCAQTVLFPKKCKVLLRYTRKFVVANVALPLPRKNKRKRQVTPQLNGVLSSAVRVASWDWNRNFCSN